MQQPNALQFFRDFPGHHIFRGPLECPSSIANKKTLCGVTGGQSSPSLSCFSDNAGSNRSFGLMEIRAIRTSCLHSVNADDGYLENADADV